MNESIAKSKCPLDASGHDTGERVDGQWPVSVMSCAHVL